jgi:hypothetical protein
MRFTWVPIAAAILTACSSAAPDVAATGMGSTIGSTASSASTAGAVSATTPTATTATDSTDSTDSTDGATSPSTATSTPPSTGVGQPGTGTGDARGVNEAEPDLRFDIGLLVGGDGGTTTGWIRFDRYRFIDLQGPELTEEPRYELATDACCRNDNPRLRTYHLASDVEVLAIDPEAFALVCDGEFDHRWDYQVVDLDGLLADGEVFVSLTFDDNREVVRIRDQTGC